MLNKNNKKFKVIDAHLHLPWQDKYKTVEEKYEYLKYEMNENNIDYGILIADSELESSIGNNKQCLEIVNNNPRLSLVYGFSPLERYEEQLNEVDELLLNKKIVGVKLYPGHEDRKSVV